MKILWFRTGGKMTTYLKSDVLKIIRYVTLMLSLPFILVACDSEKQEQKIKDWKKLFNGRDLTDWKIKIAGHELNDNYKNTFRVKNGNLIVSYDDYDQFKNEFGHIFFREKFSQYILRAEYRFVGDQVPGGPEWAYRNNGIMIHCQNPESMSIDQEFPVSIEVQLLGGNGEDERRTGNVCTPGTHIMMDGQLITNHCISSNSKTYHGDQWITVEVEVHGNTVIKHRINGEVVLEYNNPQLDEEDPDSKKLIKDGHKMLSEGYIALQAESHPIEFRKIEILNLDE